MKKKVGKYLLDKKQELGRGSRNKICKAIDTQSKSQVAIRIVTIDSIIQNLSFQDITIQNKILASLQQCKNLVAFYDTFKSSQNYYLIFQYCNGGNLTDLVQKRVTLPQQQALNILDCILEAFKILKKNKIQRVQIKADRILFHDRVVKILYPGIINFQQNRIQLMHGIYDLPFWKAPQLLRGEKFTQKADVWTLGLILFFMLYGCYPFKARNWEKFLMMTQKQEIKFPDKPQVSLKSKLLISRMVQKDPSKRMSLVQIIENRIAEIDLPQVIENRKSKNNVFQG